MLDFIELFFVHIGYYSIYFLHWPLFIDMTTIFTFKCIYYIYFMIFKRFFKVSGLKLN